MKTQLAKLSVVVGVIMAAIVLTVLYPQPAKAQAQVNHQKFNMPLDDVFRVADPFFGACLTEDIHIFGTIPTDTYTVVDANGRLHMKIALHADLAAVGLSTGDTYHTQGPQVFVVFVDLDGDITAAQEIFFHNLIQLVGPGQDGKFLLREFFHLVVNANGVQTLLVEKHELLCEGGGKG